MACESVAVQCHTLSCDVVSTPHTQHVNSAAQHCPQHAPAHVRAPQTVLCSKSTLQSCELQQINTRFTKQVASFQSCKQHSDDSGMQAQRTPPMQPHVLMMIIIVSFRRRVWAFIKQTHILDSTPAQQESLWAHSKAHRIVRIDEMHGKLRNAARREKCQRSPHVSWSEVEGEI